MTKRHHDGWSNNSSQSPPPKRPTHDHSHSHSHDRSSDSHSHSHNDRHSHSHSRSHSDSHNHSHSHSRTDSHSRSRNRNPSPRHSPRPSPNRSIDPYPNHSPNSRTDPSPNPSLNPRHSPRPSLNESISLYPNPNPSPSPDPNPSPNPNPNSYLNPSPNPSSLPNPNPSPNPSPYLNPSPNPSPRLNPNPSPSPIPSPSGGSVGSMSADSKVVWPPVVIIENARTGRDPATGKFVGLESEEIRKYLKTVKDCEFARVTSIYNVQGHRGKAAVKFPATYLGFMDARAIADCLERNDRGRESWLAVSHARGRDNKGLVTPDGKRILYGYLATERDMMDVDPKKRTVKHWSIESYKEKVLDSMMKTDEEKKTTRRKKEELVEEEKQKSLVIEQNKSEFEKAADELKKISAESYQQKKNEEELLMQYRAELQERKKQIEELRQKKMLEFQEREKLFRTKLDESKFQKLTVDAEYKKRAQRLKQGINERLQEEQHRIFERRLREEESNSNLQAHMEERLAMVQKLFNEKKLHLQEDHNKQIMKEREKCQAEKEKFLQEKLEEREREIKKAKEEAEKRQMEAQMKERNLVQRNKSVRFLGLVAMQIYVLSVQQKHGKKVKTQKSNAPPADAFRQKSLRQYTIRFTCKRFSFCFMPLCTYCPLIEQLRSTCHYCKSVVFCVLSVFPQNLRVFNIFHGLWKDQAASGSSCCMSFFPFLFY